MSQAARKSFDDWQHELGQDSDYVMWLSYLEKEINRGNDMKNYDELYESDSKWLKAKDFPRNNKLRLVISRHEEVTFDDGQPKAALSFEGKEKGVVLNGTNYERIKAIYGSDCDDWIGKEVGLSTEVIPRGKFEGQFMFRVEPIVQEALNEDIPF